MRSLEPQSLFILPIAADGLPDLYITCLQTPENNRGLYNWAVGRWRSSNDEYDFTTAIETELDDSFAIWIAGQKAYLGNPEYPNDPASVLEWIPVVGGKPIKVINRPENGLMVQIWSDINGEWLPVSWEDLRGTEKPLNARAVMQSGSLAKAEPPAHGGCPRCMSRVMITFAGWEPSEPMAGVWITGAPPTLMSDDLVPCGAQLIWVNTNI